MIRKRDRDRRVLIKMLKNGNFNMEASLTVIFMRTLKDATVTLPNKKKDCRLRENSNSDF